MNQIIKKMIDPETLTLKVLPQMQGDIQIELSAQDGDSVSVRPICGAVVVLEPNEVMDVAHARSLFISSVSPMARILASIDQETWHEIAANVAHLNVDNAAFMFLKVEASNSVKVLAKG
jgi:hypothetical protein